MSAIFHISNKTISRINLWRTDADKFRIAEFDTFLPLLIGSDYTLIDAYYMSVINKLDKTQVDFQPVKICRVSTREEWNKYYEIKIKNEITPENIHTLDSDGDKIWQFDNNLFATETVKNELIGLSNGELGFSIGFSLFAG